MAIVSSLFLGIGDAMVNILIFGLLGLRYSGDSAPAYALFNFVQVFDMKIYEIGDLPNKFHQ